VKRMFTPLAVGAAAWLLVACGGGDSPGAVSGDAAQAAAQRATGASYLVPAPEGAAASRIDSRLRGAQGAVKVWVSLEQNSVAAQRAALAEADTMLASDRKAIKSSSALRAGVAQHRQRIQPREARQVVVRQDGIPGLGQRGLEFARRFDSARLHRQPGPAQLGQRQFVVGVGILDVEDAQETRGGHVGHPGKYRARDPPQAGRP